MNNQHQKHCRADKGYKCSCFPSSEIDFMNNPPAQDQPVTPQAEECNHEIGRRTIGGFAGHEHIHTTGEQICLDCGRSLSDIIKSAHNNGVEEGKREVIDYISHPLSIVLDYVERWNKKDEDSVAAVSAHELEGYLDSQKGKDEPK